MKTDKWGRDPDRMFSHEDGQITAYGSDDENYPDELPPFPGYPLPPGPPLPTPPFPPDPPVDPNPPDQTPPPPGAPQPPPNKA